MQNVVSSEDGETKTFPLAIYNCPRGAGKNVEFNLERGLLWEYLCRRGQQAPLLLLLLSNEIWPLEVMNM